jgi:hypothetical protein
LKVWCNIEILKWKVPKLIGTKRHFLNNDGQTNYRKKDLKTETERQNNNATEKN